MLVESGNGLAAVRAVAQVSINIFLALSCMLSSLLGLGCRDNEPLIGGQLVI
jgi:hypothetical protein